MKPSKTLYRNTENKRIAGVCSGLADYFGMEVWLVRILTVTAFFLLAPPFVVVSYIAGWFILDTKPSSTATDYTNSVPLHGRKGWTNSSVAGSSNATVELKTKVWQAGEPPKQAFRDLCDRFAQTEQRLRDMETFVTSKEFQLKREINKL
ncbi:envelope stress response membrane protein PspC [Alteromonas sediminis]|uniref:Envelope stress response membrane protein PspC n=1 Tax=Alteromonas sediminis TaxID=2259342 RepID=A0A3N5XYL6_9ALTE|nr:envelope stress response membrane protein PspC [Alteromonas sediminis]RPJ65046.1 envelope stress response membrane protein PspC [Alteromonas sediminis]